MKVINSDTNNMISTQANNITLETNNTCPTRAHNNSGYQTTNINLEERTSTIRNSRTLSKLQVVKGEPVNS